MRPKELIIKAAKSAGMLSLVRDSRWRHKRLMILCYHGVAVADEHEWSPTLYVSQDQLRRRLSTLRQGGYNVLPLNEGTRRLYDGTLPPRSVALSFDDGAVDFERRALPLLREFAMPATVYLTTYYCQKRLPVINTMTRYVLWKGRNSGVDIAPLLNSSGPLRNEDAAAQYKAFEAFVAHTRALEMSADDKDALLGRVAEQVGVDYAAIKSRELLYIMSPESVRNLPRDLVDVQLHTHRHRTPRDRYRFQRDVHDNIAVIRELRGADTTLEQFCYPSGDYYGDFFPWLRECGVRYSTTCVPGLAHSGADPMLLPRLVDTMNISDLTFEAWLTGFAELLPRRREFRIDMGRLAPTQGAVPVVANT